MTDLESAPPCDDVGPRRVWRRIFAWTGTIALLLIGGGAYRLYELSQPANAIEIGPDTTVIEAPLAKDGLIDYVAALNEWLSVDTPDNNAVVLLVQAFGPDIIDTDLRPRYFELLGIPAPSDAGDYLIDDAAFFDRRHNRAEQGFDERREAWSDQVYEARRTPWTRDERPDLAAWLDANTAPLALIQEVIRRPQFYRPVLTRLERAGDRSETFPENHASRDLARMLSARSMLLIGEGDIDGAFQNLLVCHRLSRILGRGATVMDVLVANGIDALACHGDAALLHCPGLTAEQARRHAADLATLPPLPSFAEAINVAERFRSIDEIQAMVRGGEYAQDTHLEGLGALHNAAIDWNLVLRRTNEYCDNIVAALCRARYADRAARLREIEMGVTGRPLSWNPAAHRRLP